MHHLFWRVFALIVLLIAWPSRSWCQTNAATSQVTLTLSELQEMALANNRTLKIADLQIEKARHEVAAARTRQGPALGARVFEGLLSRLDFTFPAGAWGTFPTTGPIPPQQTTVTRSAGRATFLSIEAAQPLTQLASVKPAVRQLGLEREVLEERRRGRAQAITTEVRRIYYEILQMQDAIAAADAGVTLYRGLQQQAAAQVAAQSAFSADLATVQAELARREHAARVLRSSLATTNQRLGLLIGRDMAVAPNIARITSVPETPVELAAVASTAVDERPDVREAMLKVRQAGENLREKRAQRLPEISAVVRFVGAESVDVLPGAVMMAGVFATWEPFDWGRKRRGIAASATLLSQATLALEETRAQARIEVEARQRQFVDARQGIPVAERARAAAEERLRLTRVRHDAQQALLTDVLQAEASLAEANLEYQRAVLALSTAEAEYQRALGKM